MPNTSTKTYPVQFSANAFFMPKRAKKEDLLADASDDQVLKDLRPSGETLTAALELFKKSRIRGQYLGGLSVTVSGPAMAFQEIFGVRLAVNDDSTGTNSYFEDKDGNVIDLAEPKKEHPLSKVCAYLSPIIPSTPSANYPPKYPGKTTDWEKLQPYHIWPHELRKRLFGQTGVGTDQQSFIVFMLDTGLDHTHPYLQEGTPLAVETTPPGPNRFGWLVRPIDQFKVTLKPMKPIDQFKETLDDKRPVTSEAAIPVLKRDLFNSQPVIKNLQDDIVVIQKFLGGKISQGTRYVWNRAPTEDEADSARRIPDYEWIQEILRKGSVDPATGKTPVENVLQAIANRPPNLSFSLNDGMQAEGAIRQCTQKAVTLDKNLKKAFQWIDGFGRQGYDLNGHGTGMAASMLGVSRRACVACFPLLGGAIPKEFKELFLHEAGFSELDIFNMAVKTCLKLQKAPGSANSNNPFEYRILSNSYGQLEEFEEIQKTRESNLNLKNWQSAVTEAQEKNLTVVFSAGNSDPAKQDPTVWCNINALLGAQGAIIVGGAWDYDRTVPNNPDPYITLSDAAHGLVVKTPIKATIPDVCGFVGQEISGQGSPYVYIPYTGGTWHYAGGGTSSACAQVASLCGSLRAAYPNLSASQVKKIIMTSGDAVTKGTSWQKKSPTDLRNRFGELQLINIGKAFAACKSK